MDWETSFDEYLEHLCEAVRHSDRHSGLIGYCQAKLRSDEYLCPSRFSRSPHISTRQYARKVHQWVAAIGLDPTAYGAHSMRRTKVTLIYKRTKNLRAVQLLLGHSKLESTVRYLGIEVDDALEISEQTEV
ncbi:tyrosine-type recombinase/integrase [Caballeronia telluris]|uniref:Phage integrase n=1 Tax=Caballeronia telluris TaxID=326475 RepID=A0A158K0R8_9BURK|nr:phage integrase [Caballeronia telluris]